MVAMPRLAARCSWNAARRPLRNGRGRLSSTPGSHFTVTRSTGMVRLQFERVGGCAQHSLLRVRTAAQPIPVDLRMFSEMRPGVRRKPPPAVPQRPARRVPGAPRREPRHGHHYHLKPDLQRGDVPLDGRPCDPDDRNAGGSLSLRRHSLVLDHVRPRRDHQRDADAVVRSRVARGVLRRLAAYQAKTFDPLADAEPGKILHEMRGGEMAALREVPFKLYYGSVDATPLFVMLAGLYTEHTGDIETLREIWPNVEAALGWIDGPGDPDRDGFVEYHRADEKGLVNQGWKDSYDAIFHADGSIAMGPTALCEVQGYVYAAKRAAARGARRLGKQSLGDALDAQATKLAERFEAAFWCEDIGSYALALDGQKRPCCVRTSNAGQVLFSGIAEPNRAGIGDARPDDRRSSPDGEYARWARRAPLQPDVVSQWLGLAA